MMPYVRKTPPKGKELSFIPKSERKGMVLVRQTLIGGEVVAQIWTCPMCKGSGSFILLGSCPGCDGKGGLQRGVCRSKTAARRRVHVFPLEDWKVNNG